MTQLFTQEVNLPVPVALFKTYDGKPVKQMARLLGAKPKRNPLTMLRSMQLRVDRNPDQESFRNNYITTADPVIRNSKGAVKLLHYEHPQAQHLVSQLQFVDQLAGYSFPVSDDLYDAITGDGVHELPASIVTDIINNPYSNPNKREGCWEFWTRGKRELFDENLELQKAKGRSIKDSMGVYLSSNSGLRLVWFGSVGDYNFNADGYGYFLNGSDGRLVGELAPEVLLDVPKAPHENSSDLEGKIIITPGEPFTHGDIKYEMHKGVYMPTALPKE